ncbi:tetratricopeptide repeat protein [Marilutibacter maris]|uniref:hypothetical protein n=1 Tax=Marilutibacter maris TaxID=1605891 RepID=UPI000DAAA47D|nr:hypothetical protein [Lysobacter maris]
MLAAAGLAPAPPASAAKAIDKTTAPMETSTVAPPDRDMTFYRQRLALANALLREDNMAGVGRELSAVIDSPLFDTLSRDVQLHILSTACWAATREEQAKRARDLCQRAIGYAEAGSDDWYRLAMLESFLGEHEAAAAAFIEFVQRWPEQLEDIDEIVIHQLRHALPADSRARVEMAQALFDANWKSPYGGDSSIWYDLALARLGQNQPEQARAVLTRIDTPVDLIRIRSDKRFDRVFNRDAPGHDVDGALRRQIEAQKQHAVIFPDDVRAHVQLSYALLSAGRNEEVIKLADRTMARLARASLERPAFTHIDEQVWLMDSRAVALRRLGRVDDALDEMRRASQLSEQGEQNVSQALNLGDFYCSLGRPDEAMAAVAQIGEMSAYGQMVLHKVRHCAAVQRGDARMGGASLAHLDGNEDEAPTILLEALLRAGRIDEAAARLIAQLQSDDRRGRMLEWLQDYPLPQPLPGNVAMRAARAAMLARDDVTAAIAAVGRIERYDIIPTAELD